MSLWVGPATWSVKLQRTLKVVLFQLVSIAGQTESVGKNCNKVVLFQLVNTAGQTESVGKNCNKVVLFQLVNTAGQTESVGKNCNKLQRTFNPLGPDPSMVQAPSS